MPEAWAISVMPRARATWPRATGNHRGSRSCSASVRNAAMDSSLLRCSAGSNTSRSSILILVMLHSIALQNSFDVGSQGLRSLYVLGLGSLVAPQQQDDDAIAPLGEVDPPAGAKVQAKL